MKMIEIRPLENGAHRNQTADTTQNIPDGWALIPDDLVIPDTFPFVDIETEDGVVKSIVAGIVPEPEPAPEEADPQADTDAMLVDHEYRLTLLELGVTE